MRNGLLALGAALLLLAPPAARAGDDFLDRDAGLVEAWTYPYSDGGVEGTEEEEDGFDVFVDEDEEDKKVEEERFELPGPFNLRQTAPFLHLFVTGPTYRNTNARQEIGYAWGYVNGNRVAPFQLSLENSLVELKSQPPGDSFKMRTRLAANVTAWRRRSRWDATAFSPTFFFQNQTDTFNTVELGGALSQAIGQRLTVSGNLIWRRRYLQSGAILDAPVWSFGASYNFGAGIRYGGFYELWNSVDQSDDWGNFLSWQILPYLEIIADGGKNNFIRGRIVFSYALERL